MGAVSSVNGPEDKGALSIAYIRSGEALDSRGICRIQAVSASMKQSVMPELMRFGEMGFCTIGSAPANGEPLSDDSGMLQARLKCGRAFSPISLKFIWGRQKWIDVIHHSRSTDGAGIIIPFLCG